MNGYTNGSRGIPHDYRADLDRFRAVDHERDATFQALCDEIESLRETLKIKQFDYENEREFRLKWQSQAMKYEDEVKSSKSFVLALLDGDGVIFTDDFLKAGKDGGSLAAQRLQTEIKKYIAQKMSSEGDNCDVVVNIFVNLAGLAKKLAACGIIEKPTDLRNWANAFCLNQSLFNIIDVGDGKERADSKIKEMFRLYIANMQCKQILFGGCHDTGYLTFLDQYKHTERASKITLLQAYSDDLGSNIFSKFRELNFETAAFPSLFRTSILPNKPPSPVPVASTLNLPERVESPRLAHAVSAPTPAPATAGAAAGAAPGTWATISGAGAEGKKFNVAPAAKPKEQKMMYYNNMNQRIDQPLPKADRNAMSRINQKIREHGNLCNEYHFTGKCSNLDYCDFFHGAQLQGAEKLALKVKARNRLCNRGTQCNNPSCFFGHMCPNDDCHYDNCYFQHLHGMDKQPSYAIDENGDLHPIRPSN